MVRYASAKSRAMRVRSRPAAAIPAVSSIFNPVDAGLRQDPVPGAIPDDGGDLDALDPGELRRETLRIARLEHVVELVGDRRGELARQATRIEPAGGRQRGEQPRDVAQQHQVDADPGRDARPSDLHHDGRAVGEAGGMHLPDGRRRERHADELGEARLGRGAEGLRDGLANCRPRHRGRGVLQPTQLGLVRG